MKIKVGKKYITDKGSKYIILSKCGCLFTANILEDGKDGKLGCVTTYFNENGKHYLSGKKGYGLVKEVL